MSIDILDLRVFDDQVEPKQLWKSLSEGFSVKPWADKLFIFDNGKVALTWLSEHPSVTIYDNIGEVRAIHGHAGKTEIVMEPDYKRAFNELRSFIDGFSLSETLSEKLPMDSATAKLVSKN